MFDFETNVVALAVNVTTDKCVDFLLKFNGGICCDIDCWVGWFLEGCCPDSDLVEGVLDGVTAIIVRFIVKIFYFIK